MMSAFKMNRCRSALLVAALLGITAVAMSQPKISVDKTKVDMGVIYNGETKKVRIVIKNIGSDTLKISNVSTSCGCTTAKRPKDYLRRGEQDAIEVEFNSTGFRGQVEKHVSIMTNDPVASTTEVTLIGNVIEELQPVGNASVIWLGSVPVGKEVTQSVTFKNISGKIMTLTGYTSSSPYIKVLFGQRTVLPADTIRLDIKVTSKKNDYVSEQVFLETDSKKQPKVPVRVTLIGVDPN
jgi:hypothetical protein